MTATKTGPPVDKAGLTLVVLGETNRQTVNIGDQTEKPIYQWHRQESRLFDRETYLSDNPLMVDGRKDAIRSTSIHRETNQCWSSGDHHSVRTNAMPADAN